MDLEEMDSIVNKYSNNRDDNDEDNEEDEDDGDEYGDYYNIGPDDDECDAEQLMDARNRNPELFEYSCLNLEEVEKLLNESVEELSNVLQIVPSLAKVLLHEHRWNITAIVDKHRSNSSASLWVMARLKPANASYHRSSTSLMDSSAMHGRQQCPVCFMAHDLDRFTSLSACGHSFCRDCWSQYFECQIGQGITTTIGCMAQNCDVRVPEDLVLGLLNRPVLREKYQQFAFRDYVNSHPQLRFCAGANCQLIVKSAANTEISPKKVTCHGCHSSFCFVCSNDYHAPTDCQTIQRWLTKCADDSETANYISAHTKDCPKCRICIEKNGGCNHMQCFGCKHDFCWMCLGDWKAHGSEYYECSRYKENPNIAHESAHVQAREALKKYLHYYERWENHSKSLQLEQQTLNRLTDRIKEKVMNGQGTWIDWQYLFDAAALLAKCRYTLQYTYPYAYFMEAGSRKELFEYQQAQLESEIENLSWKIERAETTDRGDLLNQMDIAEKRRMTLLKDFFPVTEHKGQSLLKSGATTTTTTVPLMAASTGFTL